MGAVWGRYDLPWLVSRRAEIFQENPVERACPLKGRVMVVIRRSVEGASCGSLRLLTAVCPGASPEEISAPLPLQVHRMLREGF